MNEIVNKNPDFISRREDKLFGQINALENENFELTNAYSDLKNQYNIILDNTNVEVMQLTEQLNDAVTTITSRENQIFNMEKELEIWKMNANKNLAETIGSEEFEAEINKIQDPDSFTILRSLQIELKRANETIRQLQSQNLDALKQQNVKLETKCKKLFGEWKYQKSQAEKLKTQNDFCLGELEHYQRKVDRLQNELNKLTGKNVDIEIPDISLKYEEMVKDVCDILKIENQSDLVKSVQAIEEAYQYLPSLQSTVEQLYASVLKNNVFNAQLDSYTDLTYCIDNWAINLYDYKHLVEGLLQTLKIDDDQDRTVNFIQENVRVLIRKEEMKEQNQNPRPVDVRGLLSARDEENFLAACTILNRENSDEFVYALKDLVDKESFINEFLDSVKRRLELPTSTKDEDLITSQSKIVNIYLERTKTDDF